MDYNIKIWPFRWFGFWKEYGIEYSNYPSISSFINKQLNLTYPKASLIKYLADGLVITTTSLSAFPHPITRDPRFGTFALRTDGKWLWSDDLGELIENFDLVLPESFYRWVYENNFILPDQDQIDTQLLDWPSL